MRYNSVQKDDQEEDMATRIMSITDARQKITELVRDLDDPVYITVFGSPQAVLVRYDIYEALLEKVEDLQDSLDVLERRGEPTRDWEEIEAELAQRVPAAV